MINSECYYFNKVWLPFVDPVYRTLTRISLKCETETQSVIRYLNITHRHGTRHTAYSIRGGWQVAGGKWGKDDIGSKLHLHACCSSVATHSNESTLGRQTLFHRLFRVQHVASAGCCLFMRMKLRHKHDSREQT